MRLPSHEKRPEASAFRSVARKTRVIPFSSSSPYSSSSPPFSFFFFYCIAITRLNYGQAWHAWTNGGHRAAYKLLNNAPVPRRRDSTTLKSRLSAATRVFRRVCFQKKKKGEKIQISSAELFAPSKPISHGNEFVVSSIKTSSQHLAYIWLSISENPPRHGSR